MLDAPPVWKRGDLDKAKLRPACAARCWALPNMARANSRSWSEQRLGQTRFTHIASVPVERRPSFFAKLRSSLAHSHGHSSDGPTIHASRPPLYSVHPVILFSDHPCTSLILIYSHCPLSFGSIELDVLALELLLHSSAPTASSLLHLSKQ